MSCPSNQLDSNWHCPINKNKLGYRTIKCAFRLKKTKKKKKKKKNTHTHTHNTQQKQVAHRATITHLRLSMPAIKTLYFKLNSVMMPSFQLVEYFIPVLFFCKFHNDGIKITQATLQTKSNMGFLAVKGK